MTTSLSDYKIFQMSSACVGAKGETPQSKMVAFSFNARALWVQPWKKREQMSINEVNLVLFNRAVL